MNTKQSNWRLFKASLLRLYLRPQIALRNSLTDYLARFGVSEIPRIKSVSIARKPLSYGSKSGQIHGIKLTREKRARFTQGEIYLFPDFTDITEHVG